MIFFESFLDNWMIWMIWIYLAMPNYRLIPAEIRSFGGDFAKMGWLKDDSWSLCEYYYVWCVYIQNLYTALYCKNIIYCVSLCFSKSSRHRPNECSPLSVSNMSRKCRHQMPGYGWGNSTSKETRVASLVMSFLLKLTYPWHVRYTSMSFKSQPKRFRWFRIHLATFYHP